MPSFYHKKSLGQNFLHNRKLLERISKIKKLCNENVIEIGPGSGSLTEFILRENPKNLTVIEKDEDLKPNLNKLKESANKGIKIETYEDHRFAMSFGILGTYDLLGDGKAWLSIKDPECCGKTFPDFFNTLETLRYDS